MQKQRRYDGVVMGPDGNPLTLDDLPPPGTTRWVIRRKAEVVAAVRGGLLSLEDACARYGLTEEEFELLAQGDRKARPPGPAHDAPATLSGPGSLIPSPERNNSSPRLAAGAFVCSRA